MRLRRSERVIVAVGLIIVAAGIAGTRLAPPRWAVVFDNLHWTVGYATGALLAILGWRRATGPTRAARRCFALALSAYTVGQVAWDLQVALGWNPFPGPSDLAFLLLGPGLMAGLMPRDGAVRLAARLDAVALTIAVATLTLALYLPRSGHVDALTTTVLVAYPALLLGAAGTAVVAIVHRRLRPTPATLALLAAILADGLLWMEWNARTLDGALADGALLNFAFSVVAVGLGLAAAHWQPRPLRGDATAVVHERLARLLPMAVAIAAAVAVGVSGQLPGATRSALSVGAVIVLAIAVTRQSLLLGERDRLLAAEREAREHEARFRHADDHRAQLEAQLAQAQKLESLGTLAGGIAHDFNNILMAIYGHAQLTADEPLTASARASITDILTGCERGRDIVRRVLAFSRHREAAAVPVQPAAIATEVAGLLRAALPSSITLRVEAGANLPRIVADSAQLHQVVMNLATNAWYAIGERPGTICLGVDRVRRAAGTVPALPAGDYVTITVADDGCGMDEATRRRIFEPFFTTRGTVGGTGLGLAVVHGIVKAHGGEIEVESTPGEGTRFRIYLPVSDLGEAPAVDEGVAPACTVDGGAGREILVVDDEPVVARTLARQLHRLGWNPTTVDHPERALELVAAHPHRFAVVIVDYTMPTMTGAVLATRLARLTAGTPVVLSTGAADADALHNPAIAAVLHKPYNRNALAGALAKVAPGLAA